MSKSIPNTVSAESLMQREVQPPVLQEPVPNTFVEKRESHRFPYRGRAKALLFPSSQSPPGTTLLDSEVVTSDLSRGGVSFICRTQMQPGQRMMLMLSDNMRLAEVRWCCPVWNDLFMAGCQFLSDPETSIVDQQFSAIDVVISNETSWWDPEEPASK
jgi:hypothetical protein